MNCLIAASALLEQRPQLINEKNNDFLLLIEAIIIRLKDSADCVRQQASISLNEIVEAHFSKLQKLAFWMNPKQRDQLLIHLDEWERTRIRIDEEHGGMKNDSKNKEEDRLQDPTENEIQILNENGDPTDYLLVEDPSWAMAPNGLAFGIVPRDVMSAAEIHNHVGTRVIAMREIEKIIDEERSLESNGLRVKNTKTIYEVPKYSLLNYGSLFLRYLSILLEDTSQEVLYSIFRIIKKILAIPGFGNKGNFQNIAISIARYSFRHKVVAIRHEAQIIMKEIMLTMKARTFIGTMTECMDTENWMIKVECLKAIITCLIETNDRNFDELDYVNLISAITKCLSDDKPRVRYIATETFVTLCAYANKNVVLKLLYETVNKDSYYAICDRLDDDLIPYINGLGQVEFPYLMTEKSQSIKKIKTIDQFYNNRMLTANESLPDINKGKPLAGELSENGYNSERQSSKILRFNDAFLHQRPYVKHFPLESSRSEKTFATSIIKGSLGSKWKEPLVKLAKQTQAELEEIKLATLKKTQEKYSDSEEEEEPKTQEEINKDKNK